MSDLYRDFILEHAQNPLNIGMLREDQPSVASHHCTNASCGDDFHVYVNIQNGQIADVRWRGEGCAVSTAAASVLSEVMKHKTLDEIRRWELKDVLDHLGLENISPGRIKCVTLFLHCVQSLTKEWRDQ